MPAPIYLDGLSTTPLAPEAREAMLAAWAQPGNPGSPHAAGQGAAALVETGRAQLATLIGASPAELFFTSGATEANNLAITGTALAMLAGDSIRRHIVVSAIEHKAVIAPAERLRKAGFTVDLAPVGRDGILDLAELGRLVREDTLLVSVMAVNNETGIVQPVAEAAAIAHGRGALFHCDAAQAVGKVPINVIDLDVDYMSVSGHKMYGPGGVGALYMSSAAVRPLPVTVGGGQEQGLRAGTEPAALIAGLGAAAALASREMKSDGEAAGRLLATFLEELSRLQVRYTVNGDKVQRVPGVASVVLHGIDAQSMAQSLAQTVMVSTGSACTSGQISTSHVLEAMGVLTKESCSTLRFHFNRYLEADDAIAAAEAVAAQARRTG